MIDEEMCGGWGLYLCLHAIACLYVSSGGGKDCLFFHCAWTMCFTEGSHKKKNTFTSQEQPWTDGVVKKTDLFLTTLVHRILHLQCKILYVYILYDLITNNILLHNVLVLTLSMEPPPTWFSCAWDLAHVECRWQWVLLSAPLNRSALPTGSALLDQRAVDHKLVMLDYRTKVASINNKCSVSRNTNKHYFDC